MTPFPAGGRVVVTINGGSSSVKFALFEEGPAREPRRLAEGAIERVGTPGAQLRASPPEGPAKTRAITGEGPEAVAEALLGWLQEQPGAMQRLSAVAHRVVHGGPNLFEPQRATAEVLAELQRVAGIDPDHLPGELQLIEALGKRCAGVPQIVCFDTAFHRDLPTVAKLLPIPRRYEKAGLRRYGFHGLSYQYLMGALRRVGQSEADGRVVLAHLGSGASLAAVHRGKPIDTTMSFTPTAGLVMGTRCGDLDPGVLLYLMRSEGLSADALDRLVNKESGLKGISGLSGDARDLMARRATDPRAAEAIDTFCYQASKSIAAMAAAMEGIDTLVFAGGIGENDAVIRAQISQPLAFLGIRIDAQANQRQADVLSEPGGAVTVRRIVTDEQVVLARAALALL